jgi:ADP-ribosylglycohydrolase
VIRAANLGEDADTIASVCGARAYYGYAAIPRNWRDQLQDQDRIFQTALAFGGTPGADSCVRRD